MIIKYDTKNDALYLVLSKKKVWESEEQEKDVIVDYDRDDEVVAIEILNLKSNEHHIDLPLAPKSA